MQSIETRFVNHSNNLMNLSQFCSNKSDIWALFIVNEIIELQCECPKCKQYTMKMHNSREGFFNKCRYCQACNSHFSIFHNTILTRAHITPPVFLCLAYCWVNCYTLEATCAECNVNKNTVTNYFTAFRDSVISELTEGEQPAIGGPNMNVEIDETLISHRKYNRGRYLAPVWVFGGICRETHQVFALVVPNRTSETLTNEIAKHILAGSIIHSDTWKSYEQIEKIQDMNYTHFNVNHSKNFVDPETGSHTQTVERMWRDLKFRKTVSCGISSDEAGGYVFEYIWRRNNLKYLPRNQRLLRFLKTIGKTTYT